MLGISSIITSFSNRVAAHNDTYFHQSGKGEMPLMLAHRFPIG